jgi:urease accessory protein
LGVIAIPVDRVRLAKRLWRGIAEDETEFGFELEKPLTHEQTVWQTNETRYVVRQTPEAVLEIDLELPPSAAAGVAWAIGNLHLDLSADPTHLWTPDDPAARQLLARIGISYRESKIVFLPGRFARGKALAEPARDLGATHHH